MTLDPFTDIASASSEAALVLTLLNGSLQPLLSDTMRFTIQGGTFGRDPSNTWVVADANKAVSSQHGVIEYIQGKFYLKDISSNGIFIENRSKRLTKHEPLELVNAMVFAIGLDIDIEVTLIQKELPFPIDCSADGFVANDAFQDIMPNKPVAVDPLDLLSEPDPKDTIFTTMLTPAAKDSLEELVPQIEPNTTASTLGIESNPLDWLTVSEAPVHVLVLDEQSVPEPKAAEASLVHQDQPQPLLEQKTALDTVSTPSPSPENDGEFKRFLKAAHIPFDKLKSNTPEQLGAAFKAMTDGLIDMLNARQAIREKFQMQYTVIGRQDNNPLKFSANAQDAMENFFLKSGSGYLGLPESYHQACQDIKIHELAMVAGMRSAFEAVLAAFGPESLKKKLPLSQKNAFQRLVNKDGFMVAYQQYYQDLLQNKEATYRQLYEAAFVKAYEEAVNDHKKF